MGRRSTLIYIFIVAPLLFSYNNCSRSTGDLGQVNSSILATETLLTQGEFEFFEPSPGCSQEEGSASLILSIDPYLRRSTLESNQCASRGSAQVNFSEIFMKAHNPYMAYYNGRIYASSYLHQGVAGHFYYKEFCFNEDKQIDFTIQYIETIAPGLTEKLKDWVGIIMLGEGAERPGIHFAGGYFIEDEINQSIDFIAMNGAYQVQIEPPINERNRTALYTDSAGESIPMSCWYYNP